MPLDKTNVILIFEQVIVEEDPYEDWYMEGHEFVQQFSGVLNVDLRNTNHVLNHTSLSMNKFEVLCDNQYTSNVFVTKEFFLNIRPCNWTLCLRTQTGICCINQISDLPGVGTMWYYSNGVANILSQHKLIVDSKWSIKHSSHRFETSRNIWDLSIDCITSKGVIIHFFPAAEGLYVMNCTQYFKEGRPVHIFGNCTQYFKEGQLVHIFGKNITDNGICDGNAICNTFSERLQNSNGIDTVANSKCRFIVHKDKL